MENQSQMITDTHHQDLNHQAESTPEEVRMHQPMMHLIAEQTDVQVLSPVQTLHLKKILRCNHPGKIFLILHSICCTGV